jgi:Tol biopolymer transport system component
MMDVESGSVERLEQPNTQNIMATFSPDGNFLAFVLNGQIWVTNLETQVERAITESSKSNSVPDWSPDGRSIIFMQGSPPYVQAVNWSGDFPAGGLTSADYRLVTDAIPMRDGKWSTDGSSIIFSSNVGGDGSQHDIYIVPSSGSGATKLTNDSFFDFHPVWRP